MPLTQPLTNNYFGLMPVVSARTVIQTNSYLVSSSEAIINVSSPTSSFA